MNKAWLYSSLLGIATLGVVAATFAHGSAQYRFLADADHVGTGYAVVKKNTLTRVDEFNLHVPYDQAWSEAEAELCGKAGWKLTGISKTSQTFDLDGKSSISIAPGKVNKNLDFLEGCDNTDTYVVIRTPKE